MPMCWAHACVCLACLAPSCFRSLSDSVAPSASNAVPPMAMVNQSHLGKSGGSVEEIGQWDEDGEGGSERFVSSDRAVNGWKKVPIHFIQRICRRLIALFRGRQEPQR